MDIGIDHNLNQRSTATIHGMYGKVWNTGAAVPPSASGPQRKGLSLTAVRLPACATGSRPDRARDAGTPMLERVGDDGVGPVSDFDGSKMPSGLDN
jgi:hypothetical protein